MQITKIIEIKIFTNENMSKRKITKLKTEDDSFSYDWREILKTTERFSRPYLEGRVQALELLLLTTAPGEQLKISTQKN